MARLMGNVLETVSIEKYPEIEAIKNNLLSFCSFGAMMSGSGPSVFGLFDTEDQAKAAAEQMRGKYPKADVFVTSTITPDDFKER